MTTSELKERIRAVIDGDLDLSSVFYRLRALLADLDAEPPKPTGEPAFTVEEIIKWCSFAETTSHKADRVIEFINDPKDGIVATTRKEEK